MKITDDPLSDDYDFSAVEEPRTPAIVAAIPALPYIYDENDSRCVDILNKVADFCGKEFTEVPQNPDEEPGVPMPLDSTPVETPSPELETLKEEYEEALAKNKTEKESYWATVWQVLRFVSNLSCWTENSTDTFIVQVRNQTYSAKQANPCSRGCCKCDEDKIVIPVEYTPLYFQSNSETPHLYDPEADYAFVGGFITAVVNGKPQNVKISAQYLADHYDPSSERVYILRDDFPEILLGEYDECCCLTLRDVRITLTYNAGYKTIPDALLSMICPLLSRINDSKLSLNNCATAMTQVSGLLKSKKVGNVQYAWSDKDSEIAKTQALYTELFNIASIAELNALSRCAIVTAESAGEVI